MNTRVVTILGAIAMLGSLARAGYNFQTPADSSLSTLLSASALSITNPMGTSSFTGSFDPEAQAQSFLAGLAAGATYMPWMPANNLFSTFDPTSGAQNSFSPNFGSNSTGGFMSDPYSLMASQPMTAPTAPTGIPTMADGTPFLGFLSAPVPQQALSFPPPPHIVFNPDPMPTVISDPVVPAQVDPAPEPSSLVLIAGGILCLMWMRRRGSVRNRSER